MKRLVVMLPTLDEEEGLLLILPKIPFQKLKKLGWETQVWMIDGGSLDRSIEIAKQYHCHIIIQAGKGKGAAMRTGFTKFLESDCDAVVMLDSDGTYDVLEIPRLVSGLETYDVVTGDRLRGKMEPEAMTSLNYFGNHMLTWFASGLYGISTNDLCTGYWAFNRNAIANLKLNSMRFEIEAEMFASCVNEDLMIGSVPVSYSSRVGDAKLGSIVDGWIIFKKLLIRRIFGNPIEASTGKGNLDIE